MSKATEFILKGKKNKGNLKQQSYINYAVLSGFVLMGIWTIFIYPKTFIPTPVLLGIILLPSLVVTLVLYKKILVICGYSSYLKGNIGYTIAIKVIVYILVTLPVGNALISIVLFSNYFLAESKVQIFMVKPYAIDVSTSRKTNSTYSHADIQFDGIEKQLNFGNLPLDSLTNSTIRLKVSKGALGYYIIRGRRALNQASW